MPPASPPAHTTAGVARRDEIVRQAAALFDRIGYHNATMDLIAQAVGVRKPTLYHYFQAKSTILLSIHEEFIDLLLDKHRARAVEALPPGDALLAVMEDILELMHTHRGHVRVFFEHHRELEPREQVELRRKRDEYAAAVEEIIAEGVRRGEFITDNPRLTSLGVFGMCNWAYQWYQASGPLPSEDIARHFWGLLVNGLGT